MRIRGGPYYFKDYASVFGAGLARTRTFAESDPFLRNTSQQPQMEIDISSTFVLDANNEVWELNSHELGFSVPNKKGPRKSTF